MVVGILKFTLFYWRKTCYFIFDKSTPTIFLKLKYMQVPKNSRTIKKFNKQLSTNKIIRF